MKRILLLLPLLAGCAHYEHVYALDVGTDQFDLQHPEQSSVGIHLTCEWKGAE